MTQRWQGHPVWLVGFRPFFPLAGLTAAALPLLWLLVLTGRIAPPSSVPMTQWHAHEMFYGFGMAVLGGFLLTATKNWVSVRGHHGRALQVLVAAWGLERVALWWGGSWPRPLFLLSSQLFLVTLVALILWTLLKHRATDSYKDNIVFIIALPVFIGAKALLLEPTLFATGRAVTLGLFRLAFVVMLERTLTPFMKAAFQLALPRVFVLDTAIKALALSLVFAPLLPEPVRLVLSGALALLFLGRLLAWSPHRALTRIDVGVMYAGALALVAELVLSMLEGRVAWVGALPVHVFTFGTMGLIIPAMMTRIAKGHTGRPVAFDRADQAALGLMGLAFLARVVAPQVHPDYPFWLWTSAGCWSACFVLITARITPLVLRARIDGKEH